MENIEEGSSLPPKEDLWEEIYKEELEEEPKKELSAIVKKLLEKVQYDLNYFIAFSGIRKKFSSMEKKEEIKNRFQKYFQETFFEKLKKEKKDNIFLETDDEILRDILENLKIPDKFSAFSPLLIEIKQEIDKKIKNIKKYKNIETAISVLADNINKEVGVAAGGLEALKIKGELEKKKTEEFLSEIFRNVKKKYNIWYPLDWLAVLRELESIVIPAAKEFVKKTREDFENNLKRQGLL